MELPGTAKATLDQIRARRTPTLPGHHLLKVIDSSRVDSVEAELFDCGQGAAELADSLRNEIVYRRYAPGRVLPVYHVRLDGTVLTVGGRIRGFQPGRALELERMFKGGGRYDGLGVTAEFYPDCVRYVDLEVDVVRWPDGTVRMVDREHLQRAVAEGVVGGELASRALAIATELQCRLRGIAEQDG